MYKKSKCPMMLQAEMKHEDYMQQAMPMGYKSMMCPMHHMHHMQQMPYMHMGAGPKSEMMYYEEDEKDDDYMMEMYSPLCKKMMPKIDRVLDKMDEKGDALYSVHLDREMVKRMTDEAYEDIIKDMPESEHCHEDRQYGQRPFLRDLVGALLFSRLFRRRRRRRRFPHYGYGYGYPGFGGYGRESYDEDFNPFDYKDFYYDID